MFTITDDEGAITMVEEPSPDYVYTYAGKRNILMHVLSDIGKFEGLKMYAAGHIIHSTCIDGLQVDVKDILQIKLKYVAS